MVVLTGTFLEVNVRDNAVCKKFLPEVSGI